MAAGGLVAAFLGVVTEHPNSAGRMQAGQARKEHSVRGVDQKALQSRWRSFQGQLWHVTA